MGINKCTKITQGMWNPINMQQSMNKFILRHKCISLAFLSYQILYKDFVKTW